MDSFTLNDFQRLIMQSFVSLVSCFVFIFVVIVTDAVVVVFRFLAFMFTERYQLISFLLQSSDKTDARRIIRQRKWTNTSNENASWARTKKSVIEHCFQSAFHCLCVSCACVCACKMIYQGMKLAKRKKYKSYPRVLLLFYEISHLRLYRNKRCQLSRECARVRRDGVNAFPL